MYYDKHGEPIDDVILWARLFEDMEYRRVAMDWVGELWVSTVWLGLDHNMWLEGPPLIFETMIFEDNKKYMPLDGKHFTRMNGIDQLRYSTLEQAENGHREVVQWLKDTILESENEN